VFVTNVFTVSIQISKKEKQARLVKFQRARIVLGACSDNNPNFCEQVVRLKIAGESAGCGDPKRG
jgi:hypothetical protein